MKRILKIAALALTIVLGSALRNKSSAQAPVSADVSYQTFYDELSPYGQWVDYPDQGYVWVPDAGADFRPYATNGHWVWTDDYEWMWVSDYDWGWAPFHYGRWMEDSHYGWIWVPGYEWSPAWVAWRDGGDYYGWAPLRPGINISINFSIGSYSPPYDYWSFAPRRYITSPRIYDYCYDRGQNITIINQTTIINNYRYNRNVFVTGPRRGDVERYTGRISPVRFRASDRPGRTQFRNNEVSTYRPSVQRDDSRRFAPRKFDRYNGAANNDNRITRNDNRNDRNNGRTERTNNLPRRDDNVNNRPQRPANPQVEQRRQDQPRQFERRNTDAPVRQPRPDVRNENNNRPQRSTPQTEQRRQDQPRQFERRTDAPVRQPQRPSPQVEQRRQEQPRQFERRNESRGQSNTENRGQNNNGNNGRGNGRHRS